MANDINLCIIFPGRKFKFSSKPSPAIVHCVYNGKVIYVVPVHVIVK